MVEQSSNLNASSETFFDSIVISDNEPRDRDVNIISVVD